MIDARKHSQFWSKIAEKYDSVVDLQIGPDTRAMVRERLASEGRLGAVVEFGCGAGFYTGVMAERAERLVATDLAPWMLAIAKRNIKAANVSFREEACQQTSFPGSTFDTAFLGLVLHFTDPRKALAETRRILKPGGTVIILNPDPGTLSGWNRFRWLARGYTVSPATASNRRRGCSKICRLKRKYATCCLSSASPSRLPKSLETPRYPITSRSNTSRR